MIDRHEQDNVDALIEAMKDGFTLRLAAIKDDLTKLVGTLKARYDICNHKADREQPASPDACYFRGLAQGAWDAAVDAKKILEMMA